MLMFKICDHQLEILKIKQGTINSVDRVKSSEKRYISMDIIC